MIRSFPSFFKFINKNFAKQTSLALRCQSNVASATIQVKTPCKYHKLDEIVPTSGEVTKEEARDYCRKMVLIRRMETAAGNLYKEQKIRGFCHLYSGQEAVAVGICAALKPTDAITTSYREHAWTYLKGRTIAQILCELTGKKTGAAEGKGGSMHMFGPNFYGGNAIIGAQVPMGAGIALAMQYKGMDEICVALYGDGAANQGQIFETYNMAKLWDLPCLFVCENNGFGMGTASARASASTLYYTRGDFVPGIWVDGMDVVAMREATKKAAEYIRSGKGPLVMEAATYRYHGHSMSDPGTSYRTREQVQEVRTKRDPINGFKERIFAANLMTEADFKQIEEEVKVEIDAAVKSANEDPDPKIEDLYTQVLSQYPQGFKVRGCDPTLKITPYK